MKVHFDVHYELAPKVPSLATGEVYGTFGLEAEQGLRTYVEPFSLELVPGQIVAFVGVSGSGKSSCLRQFGAQTGAFDVGRQPFTEYQTVIEHLVYDTVGITEAMGIAAQCGLAEAQLFLRYPDELSEGQQYRLRLAMAMARNATALMADEFLSTLDRTQAKVIAYNLHRLVRARGLVLAVATTHEDILDDLAPDHLVRFDGHQAQVTMGGRPKALPGSRSLMSWSLAEVLAGTGTCSVGGTIADRPSA